ncbi:MAG: prenyltransferase/squalene oxidase repeat-containing protein [Verrucomicrobiota bacterium]
MKLSVSIFLTLVTSTMMLDAQEAKLHHVKGDISLKLEIQRHIDKGLKFLASQQAESGSWGDETYPALTAMPLSAIMSNPERDPTEAIPPELERAYQFLLSKQNRTGGIFGKGLATYNTSLSIMAMLHQADRPEIEQAIRKARNFLINQQADFDERGVSDSPMDGGIGYGGTYPHSDLSNTHLAMEALYHSRQVLADRAGGVERKLDWGAAIDFVTKCQNVEQNPEPYLAISETNKGGFVYFPGDSKAGAEGEEKDGKVALRSYGSMSYAGLLSFVYAEMSQTDPRVQAVEEWLGKNFSLEENPGMGAQGLYYYYHTMAKALTITGKGDLTLHDGSKVDWKEQLAIQLFDTHQPDGSWINEGSSRWWEDDPILVTSYALLSLAHISRQL